MKHHATFYLKRICVIISIILLAIPLSAQQENIWVFGKKAGLDFNSNPPVPIHTNIYGVGEGGASVCDENGQLLFYTEGSVIWNRNHDTMPNGTNLTGMPYLGSYSPTSSTTQNALIVPMPDSAGKYYVFSLTPQEFYNTQINISYGKLYYSVVDMSLNGGLGDVVAGRKKILVDSNLSEKMTGVVGDRCNVWVICFSMLPKGVKAYEITAAGINTTAVYSSIGLYPALWYSVGVLTASPNRRKLAACSSPVYGNSGGIELYDFDPVNGLASNNISLDSGQALYYYGAAFSPDNSKLYAPICYSAPIGDVQQFDLSNVPITQTPINTNIWGGQMKLAPDGKIYYITEEPGRWLGTINFPNLAAPACGYNNNVVQLYGGPLHLGLPNVVPVFHRDTVHSSTILEPPCFSVNNGYELRAADTTGWDYVWSNGATTSGITTDTPGIYRVSYHTPPCVYHTDSFQVQLNSRLPQIQPVTGCKNERNGHIQAIPAAGDTITYSYTWRDNSNQVLRGPVTTGSGDTLTGITAGAYTLQITAPNGCDTVLSITVSLPDYEASFTISDSIICMGDTLFIQNTSQGSLMNWLWVLGDGTFSSVSNPQHAYNNSGIYTVRLTGRTSTPCYDTAYKTFAADPKLTGAFIPDQEHICTGQMIRFSPQTDSTVTGLSWDFGDDSGRLTSNELTQHAYDMAGAMPVLLLSHFRACPDTSFIDTIHVYSLPKVYLGPDSGICFQGAPILLQNLNAPPAEAYHNLWNTGDTTETIKVVHPGIYSLTVMTAPLDCSTTENIIVLKDCYIDIPNAFTPNGDGINDQFFPRQLLSRKVTRFNMQLFNRWGEVIFETNKTDGRGWDGRFNNKDQPQGVYVYMIDVEVAHIHQEHYQGNVTLIR